MGPRDGCTSNDNLMIVHLTLYFFIADSLGGDLHWSAGASLISNIPRKPHWPVKTHLWVNAGRLDAVDQRKCRSNIMNLINSPIGP